MKIATIIGTRPEIIKTAPLIPLLDSEFEHTLVFTGQHYSDSMKENFFNQLSLRRPDIDLEIRSSSYSDLLPPLKKVFTKELRDTEYIIVYGDTNSTLSAALSAIRFKKKLIHIEAGLRSFDVRMWEELVRVLVDHLSDLLFTPTELSSLFLEREGIVENKFIVGNTVVDAIKRYRKTAEKNSDILNKLNLNGNDYVLLTLHRAENVDDPEKLRKIFFGLSKIPYNIIFPVHPRTSRRINEFGIGFPSNIKCIEPVGYLDMIVLLKNSRFVLTDSGGLQEEAITLGVPCITLRETTERWETVNLGANFLAGSDPILISYYAKMIELTGIKDRIRKIRNPYGNGNASKKILKILKKELLV